MHGLERMHSRLVVSITFKQLSLRLDPFLYPILFKKIKNIQWLEHTLINCISHVLIFMYTIVKYIKSQILILFLCKFGIDK